jgi:hypothetical protein
MFAALWKWLSDNGTAIGVVLAAIPLLWAVVQYIRIKRAEDRRIQFTTFHDLIKQLVEREDPNQPMRLDRQIAVIFELRARTFKRYYPVTLRILEGLKNDWEAYGPEDKRKRLMQELDLAIAHLKKKI